MGSRKLDVVQVGTGELVSRLHARILVWARTGSRDWRDRWGQLLRRLGLKAEPVSPPEEGEPWGWETCWDVWGSPFALQELTLGVHKQVVRWEHVTTAIVNRASGAEERTSRSRAPLAHAEKYNR